MEAGEHLPALRWRRRAGSRPFVVAQDTPGNGFAGDPVHDESLAKSIRCIEDKPHAGCGDASGNRYRLQVSLRRQTVRGGMGAVLSGQAAQDQRQWLVGHLDLKRPGLPRRAARKARQAGDASCIRPDAPDDRQQRLGRNRHLLRKPNMCPATRRIWISSAPSVMR